MDRLRLNPSPSSVSEARRFSQRWLESAGASELTDVVTLLVSELVTNVVLHAQTSCELSLERRGDRLRVSVADEGEGLPVRKAIDPEAGSGRGLLLVDAMSLEAGLEVSTRGKQVWCELGWPDV
jgi:anti-sigma regulatory factor (Ser/Thr protein kinase)